MSAADDCIASLTRDVADFPKPGVQFKDLTPLFADAAGWPAVTDALAEVASGADLVAGIDSRGFLVAAAVAARLGIGVLAIRKGGKLPPPVHSRALRPGVRQRHAGDPCRRDRAARPQRRASIDDVLATGGTLAAAARLLARRWCRRDSARPWSSNSAGLGGRRRSRRLPVHSLPRSSVRNILDSGGDRKWRTSRARRKLSRRRRSTRCRPCPRPPRAAGRTASTTPAARRAGFGPGWRGG